MQYHFLTAEQADAYGKARAPKSTYVGVGRPDLKDAPPAGALWEMCLDPYHGTSLPSLTDETGAVLVAPAEFAGLTYSRSVGGWYYE